MTKEADLRCYREFKGTDIKGLLAVHDALVFEVPGKLELDLENSKKKGDLWTSLSYKPNEEASQAAALIVQIMEDTETDFFTDLDSPIKGKADFAVCPFWNH